MVFDQSFIVMNAYVYKKGLLTDDGVEFTGVLGY